MNKVRTFFLNLATEVELIQFARRAVFGLGIVLFVAMICNIAGMLYETRATKGIVFAKDNDAGRGIQTATLTRWWNSNHFAPYGNLYFRFAHTIAKIVPSKTTSELPPSEREEMEHHFALTLTSLFFLSGLSLFIGFLISGTWSGAIWLGIVILNLGTFDQTWVEFLFRVHPDHTLMFFCLVSSYFTLRYTNSKQRKDFLLAALFWGIATAVKRSTILFIPSFLWLFLSEGVNRASLRKGIQFAGYMLLAYLIVGFPQNFGFYKHIRFLYIETFNSTPATKESILDYLWLIFRQSRYIWAAILVSHVIFGKREKKLNKQFLIFGLIALLVVLAGNMNTSHSHHIMPHVALFFITMVYAVKYLPVLQYPRKRLALAAIVIVTLILLPENTTLKNSQAVQLNCRPEIKKVLQFTAEYQKAGHLLIRDPYFPFSSSYPKLTKQIWGINGEILDKENAKIWGTQKGFLRNLHFKAYRPHIYPDMSPEQWEAKKALAVLAQTADKFTTPNGSVYEKIHEDSCGYMVWKKKD